MAISTERPPQFADAATYARWVASQRPTRTKPCVVCNTPFETIGRGLYCSPKCAWTRSNRKRLATRKAGRNGKRDDGE